MTFHAAGRIVVHALVAGGLLTSPARAAERLDLLIVEGQSNHDWQSTGTALAATLRNTGRFVVTRSASPPPGASDVEWANWRPQFTDYDVVVSTYKGKMWPAEVRTAFEAYVAGGGGAVIFHAPLATFFTPHLEAGESDWDAYSSMMGLGWRPSVLGQRIVVDDATGDPIVLPPPLGGSSNHGQQHAFVLKTRRPNHPILDGLPLEWRHGTDELYHAMRGPAEGLEVLASAFSDLLTGGTGVHEPMLWTVPYGAGRVVTTPMGHRWFGSGYGPPGTPSENGPDAVHCVGFQTILARSAEWAATSQVTIPMPDAFPTLGATSVVNPGKGVWLKLGLKVNGQHPASDVVVTNGPVELSLDMAPGGFADPLDFYLALVFQGQVFWITAAGLSTVPGPLASLTPIALQDVDLLSLGLPANTVMTFVTLFAEGGTGLAYDVVSAVAVAP